MEVGCCRKTVFAAHRDTQHPARRCAQEASASQSICCSVVDGAHRAVHDSTARLSAPKTAKNLHLTAPMASSVNSF